MRRQHVQGYGARPAFWSLHGLVRERPPACLGDLYARDLDRTSAGDHALGLCGRMSDAYQLNHLLDRKAMRDQDRFRASIGAGRKQLERAPAAAVGFGRCLRPCLDFIDAGASNLKPSRGDISATAEECSLLDGPVYESMHSTDAPSRSALVLRSNDFFK
jgi:hypothetical protein